MHISITNPTDSQILNMKKGIEIRIKKGSDRQLECEDSIGMKIEDKFKQGKGCMMIFNLDTNQVVSIKDMKRSDTNNKSAKENIVGNEGNKQEIENILELMKTINSVDEYMNFANTIIDNNTFNNEIVKTMICTLKTMRENAPYLISYNQYYMISREIINNVALMCK
jgi:hypothetical protein